MPLNISAALLDGDGEEDETGDECVDEGFMRHFLHLMLSGGLGGIVFLLATGFCYQAVLYLSPATENEPEFGIADSSRWAVSLIAGLLAGSVAGWLTFHCLQRLSQTK